MAIPDFDLIHAQADVIIILSNPDTGQHRIMPHWECKIPPSELLRYATAEAHTFAEECGWGYVDYTVRDFRHL